jgi:hypothetical protein
MNDRTKNLFLGTLTGLLVAALGTWEDWFGRFDYAGDAISYLDIAKAIRHGEWSLALNPYWSIGYPMILAATRWMFPSGPQGEWLGIHVVNLVIFLATYVSFLYLLKVTMAYLAGVIGLGSAGPHGRFVFTIGSSIFILLQLLVGNVSRVNPDLLVSGAFFLLTALALQFCLRPSVKIAVLMGVLAGLGYVLKAAFLPESATVFFTVLLYGLTRLPGERLPAVSRLAWALPAMALVILPYVAALSEVLGAFTLGESGSLNYAWSVNGLPHWDNWQGGSAQLGMPVHPSHLLLRNPPIFAFAEPFPVTYPPWYNSFYWYEGYRHFFSVEKQLSAVRFNFDILRSFCLRGPRSLAVVALVATGIFLLKDRHVWWKRLLALWPLYLPSIIAIGLYLLVVIELRYVVGFLIVLLSALFLPLFVPTPLVGKRVGLMLAVLVAVISVTVLAANNRDVIGRAIHHQSYTDAEQWRVGLYLAQSKVRSGEKVALARNTGPVGWAYIGDVHIVAEMGNSTFDREDGKRDFELFTKSPEIQQTAFKLFRQAGAVLVVAYDVEGPLAGQGWEPVPGTQSWIHRLDMPKIFNFAPPRSPESSLSSRRRMPKARAELPLLNG